MSTLKAIVNGWTALSQSLPQFADARPRHSRLRLTLEHLEGRVVPSTILVTSLLDSGRGTLRAAIEKANRDLSHQPGRSHGDTIKFARSARGIIYLDSALPVLSAHIAISAPTPVDLTQFPVLVARKLAPATPPFRIFTVAKGAVVSISNMVISGGSATNGAGIDNAGKLSLIHTLISSNTATGGSDCYGGAIVNTGTLSITGCLLTDNSAEGTVQSSGGAIQNFGTLSISTTMFGVNTSVAGTTGGTSSGGGIANSGTLTITNCMFGGQSATGGSSSSGGAIDNSGTLSVAGSEFGGNTVTVLDADGSGHGGAIHNSGTLVITNSTFNASLVHGGFAGFGGAIDNSGTLSVTNTYFIGNSATSPDASGIGATAQYGYGGGINNSGMLSVTNSTFVRNTATGSVGGSGGAIADSGTASLAYVTADVSLADTGGAIAITSGTQSLVTSIDSIFQNSQGESISVAAGSFQSLGHNIFTDDPSVSLDPTDLVNTDPLLGKPENNGGPTGTEALLPGSPAIDAGISVAGITTDQRGAPRPLSGTTDIGAFQVQPPLTVRESASLWHQSVDADLQPAAGRLSSPIACQLSCPSRRWETTRDRDPLCSI